jgi:glyoxylase-like metal-dependent hydrolase (beta-lactamase superfamily II)
MSLYLKQREVGPMENFQYLIGDDGAKKCWMVDPAWEAESLYDEAVKDGYSVEGLLITHAHFDHTNAVAKILAKKDVPVYLQKRELEFLDKHVAPELFPDIPRSTLKAVDPGDKITLGGVTLTFVHTPGHTPGSQCFAVGDRLVSGDTLFLGTCGRVDLPGGNPYELFETLNGAIAKFSPDTVLLPGHNYSSHGATAPLGEVRKNNRFFHAHTLESFLGMLGF